MTKIKFGTDGWRAAIGEDYTFHNVRRCARGVAEYLKQIGAAERGVVVAHDRRFASEHFARACVEVLAAHGIRSMTPPEAVPTQVASFFTRELRAGAGIVITASHNPWTDNGFKVKADTGGAAAPEMLAAIEATMDRHAEDELPPRMPYEEALAGGLVEEFDPYPRFRDQLASIVDLEKIRAADKRVLVEPLYGSGAGWFTRLLGGGGLTVRELHTERNPFFGGLNPEPIRPNVDEWLDEIPRWGADIGIAFDGDADRVGMATEEGVFVNQLQVYGLLYWYLLDVRGQIGPAVYTVTTTSMVPRLAELYGTQAHETGVGFKREVYEGVKQDTLARLEHEAPDELVGVPVVKRIQLDTRDGFKFYRQDGTWLLIRFSGTEALLRIYAEARSPDEVQALIVEGRELAAAGAVA